MRGGGAREATTRKRWTEVTRTNKKAKKKKKKKGEKEREEEEEEEEEEEAENSKEGCWKMDAWLIEKVETVCRSFNAKD